MTTAHILTRTPQGPFLLDASASTAVWRERRSSPNVWDFVPNDQRSGSRASDTGIPGSGTTTVTVGRASPCRGAAPRRSPPMCSQYSAAEFPQRGDNPGTWRGSTREGRGIESCRLIRSARGGWLGGRQQDVAASSEPATPCLLASGKLAGQELDWLRCRPGSAPQPRPAWCGSRPG